MKEKRYCIIEDCGKELPEKARPTQLVCSDPVVDLTNIKCRECGNVLVGVTDRRQVLCKLTKKEKELTGEKWSKCQLKSKEKQLIQWRINRRDVRIKTPKKIYHKTEDYKPKQVIKKRKCIGVLSHDDAKGEHWFDSNSPFNRVCDECQKHVSAMKSTTYNIQTPEIVGV
jgi:hypothetical protein